MGDARLTPAESADRNDDQEVRMPEPLDDTPVIAVDELSERKKKYRKRWSELTTEDRKRRVLWIAGVVFALVAATVFTVYACVAADRTYNTPRYATESLSTRAEVNARCASLAVPSSGLGDNERYYLIAKNRFDLRYAEAPDRSNLAGYRATFLAVNRGNTDTGIFMFRLEGLLKDAPPVLTDNDGNRIMIPYSDVEARDIVQMRLGDTGTPYAVYRLTAVIDGNLYVVTAETQSEDGRFAETEREFAQSRAKQVLGLLIDAANR